VKPVLPSSKSPFLMRFLLVGDLLLVKVKPGSALFHEELKHMNVIDNKKQTSKHVTLVIFIGRKG
jgi:hypothetical protein